MTAHPLFGISGRTALVTGSSRGIGLALARGLAEAGCTVVLNGRDGERLTKAAAELPGERVRTAVSDVTDGPSVAAGIADVEERVGPLDILVNNAGMQLRAPLLEFTDSDWHRILDTNLTSAFLVGREAARRMTERGHGKIINICSLQSEVVRPGIAPYAATKGALKMLTKGMCADWGPYGVPGQRPRPRLHRDRANPSPRGRRGVQRLGAARHPGRTLGAHRGPGGRGGAPASPTLAFVNRQVVCIHGDMTSVLSTYRP